MTDTKVMVYAVNAGTSLYFRKKGKDNMSESEKLDLILSEVQGMKEDIQGIKSEMQGMKEDIQNLKDDMQKVNQKITVIHLILENDIRVSIQRVAEGHLDLSRNLHEAMKPSKEVEVLSIKVRKLESDMKMVKAQIGCT